MWRKMRAAGAPIVSTWIDEAGEGESPSLASLWSRIVREASTATALIHYCEDEEVVKHALAEIGAALAADVPVFWVGPTTGYSIVEHPNAALTDSLDLALAVAQQPRAMRGFSDPS